MFNHAKFRCTHTHTHARTLFRRCIYLCTHFHTQVQISICCSDFPFLFHVCWLVLVLYCCLNPSFYRHSKLASHSDSLHLSPSFSLNQFDIDDQIAFSWLCTFWWLHWDKSTTVRATTKKELAPNHGEWDWLRVYQSNIIDIGALSIQNKLRFIEKFIEGRPICTCFFMFQQCFQRAWIIEIVKKQRRFILFCNLNQSLIYSAHRSRPLLRFSAIIHIHPHQFSP